MSRATGTKKFLVTVLGGRDADLMLHSLGFRPSSRDASEYVHFYSTNAVRNMRAARKRIADAGLNAQVREVWIKRNRVSKKKSASAANPRPARAPNAQIIALNTAKDARLKRDAAALTNERRRQVSRVAAADAAARASAAVIRSRGD